MRWGFRAIFVVFWLLGCGSAPAEGGAPGASGGTSSSDSGTDSGAGGSSGSGGAACSVEPASSEPVTLANDNGTLAGTLEIPAGCRPVPVVVILSGSGTTDRDGNVPGDPDKTDVYKLLAAALADQGKVASLRYDDHGISGSVSAAPKAVEDFRFDLEIEDAARWVTWLRKDARFSRVLVAGHSQGSLTGILAARQAPIDGWISLAGAGRPAGDVLRTQLQGKLTPAQLAELDAAIEKLESGQLAGPLSPPLDQILPEFVQPYLISWLKYDPKQEVALLSGPGLIVQGLTDRQVSTLDADLLGQGKPDAKVVFVDDMSHPLKQATSDPLEQKAAYSDPSVPLAPGLMPPLVEFLETAAK